MIKLKNKHKNALKILISINLFLFVSSCSNQVVIANNLQTIQNKQSNTYISYTNRVKFKYNGSLSNIKVESLSDNNIEQIINKHSEFIKNEYRVIPIVFSINPLSEVKIVSTNKDNEKAFLIGKYPKPYQNILNQPLFNYFVISSSNKTINNLKNSINFEFSDRDNLLGIMDTIQDNSILKNKTDWNIWKSTVLKEFDQTKDLHKSIKLGLTNLKDRHSSLWTKSKADDVYKGNEKGLGLDFFPDGKNRFVIFMLFPNSPAEKSGLKIGDIIEKSKKNSDESVILDIYRPLEERKFQVTLIPDFFETNLPPKVYTIKNNILYIELTASAGQYSSQKYPNLIHDEINKINLKEIKGIILDLRRNTGGYTAAMLDAVGPLLGDNQFGGRLNNKNERNLWSYKDGQILLNNQLILNINTTPYKLADPNIPIYTLISNITASAGEAVAVAFRGRNNTTFIGEKTYGLSTGNITFILHDTSWLNLTNTVNIDRNGVEYFNGVETDKYIKTEWQYFQDIEKDQVLKSAIDNIK